MGCNSTNFLLALLPENQFLASASSSTRRPPEALHSSPLQPIGPKTPPSDEVGVASGFRRDLRGDELVQCHGGGHRPRPAHQLQVLALPEKGEGRALPEFVGPLAPCKCPIILTSISYYAILFGHF